MNKHMLDYQQIGLRLQEARQKMKITQQELARMAGVSTSYVGHLERGFKRGSLDTLAEICSILNLSMDYVLFGIDIQQDKDSIIRGYLEDQLALLNGSTHSCPPLLKDWNHRASNYV